MATVTRFVNTSSTAGSQDGTTNVPGNSGTAAYEALQTWESAEQTDLVTDTDTHVVICDPAGGAEAGTLGINGWTTGSGNEILIKAAAGSEHDGVSRENSGTGYQLKTTSKTLTISEDYITFDDMEFTINANANCIDFSVFTATTNLITFNRCIFTKVDATTGNYLLSSGDADLNLVLENCLQYGYTGRGFDMRTTATVTINHCGFLADNGIGFLTDGSAAITNSWFFNNGGAAFHSGSSAPASDSNNGANDTSMTDEGFAVTNSHESLTMANEITAVGTNFAQPTTADGTIKSDGTLTFDDAGTGSLADDITNTSREGVVDIGPYELIAAGGAASKLVVLNRRRGM